MIPTDRDATAHAQRLRLKRVLWGSGVYCCTSLIVLGCYLSGFIEARHVVGFFAAVVMLNLGFIGVILSGLNLRLHDPSMTGAQIIFALLPSIYVMYHLTEPQARVAFLLIAMVAMLFGVFRFGFRGMLSLGGAILLSYLGLLAALQLWAPERLNIQVEAIIVFAYAVMLSLVAYLGSFIAGLRRTLMTRNRDLEAAMTELRELATRDPLTRLPNRRTLMQVLDKEAARSRRRNADRTALCLCMLDVDLFKRINDTYGHQVGDAVLRRVAATLRKSLRAGDFIGRFGGEEFLLLMPDSTRESAAQTAEQLRRMVESLEMPELPKGEVITISLGIAIHQAGETVDQTLGRADAALYEAKRRGRNHVVIEAPFPLAPAQIH